MPLIHGLFILVQLSTLNEPPVTDVIHLSCILTLLY